MSVEALSFAKKLVESARNYVSGLHAKVDSAHDLSHLERVRGNALAIAAKEGGDLLVIELSALLHDVDDSKLMSGTQPLQNLREWFLQSEIESELAVKIENVITHVGFKASGLGNNNFSLETQIVRDADRLEAIGAIGIARCFAYNGHKGESLFCPAILPRSIEGYRAGNSEVQSSAINHFFEKLLLIKDGLLTSEGKRLGEERHSVMVRFLESFFSEWYANSSVPTAWEELIRLRLDTRH